MGPQGMLEGVTVVSTLVPRGYRMEFCISWSLLPEAGPNPGQRLGFDWAVIDVPASRQFHHARSLRWTGSSTSWRHTRDLAGMTLGD